MIMYKDFEVIKKVKECRGVVSLYLKSTDDDPLVPFLPGQHLLFKINVPGKEIQTLRYYSFSDAFNGSYYRISVKKELPRSNDPGIPAGLCSSYLVDSINEGDILKAKGPSGDFYLRPEETHPVVLIAGGIGITPLLSMLKSIATSNPTRQVHFYYGINESCDHAFKKELEAVKINHPSFNVVIYYMKASVDDMMGSDYDYEGFINAEKILEEAKDKNNQYYICGPDGMMKAISTALEAKGVASEKIHKESFKKEETESLIEVGERKDEINGILNKIDDDCFVEFAVSGRKLRWDKRYRSLLEFAEANEIEISSGCLFGDCGSCLTRLREGEVKYIHPTMVKPLEGTFLPCSTIPVCNVVMEA